MGGPPSQDGQVFAGDAMPGPAGSAGPAAGAGPGPATGSAAGGPDAPGRPDGSGAPDPTRRSRRGKGKGRAWWIELPILLAFALVLALLIKTFVVQAFFIPSSSMENTLEIGDKVLVNKMVYDFRPIHRGDVVVFNGEGSWDPVSTQPKPPQVRLWNAISGLFGTAPGVHDYIKRVIGIPGDHVACCDSQGRITVNGVPLTEKSYLYPGNSPSTENFSIIVPPGRLWVMGDHRSVSYDSRGHTQDPGNGTVPQDRVVGRAFVIVAPVSRWRVLPIPATFDQPRLSSAFAGPHGHGGTAALPTLPGPVAAAAPLGLGLVGAFPLTWLQMRLRRRLGGPLRRARSRRRPLARPGRVPRGPQRPGAG
jgi:signal peptidase I